MTIQKVIYRRRVRLRFWLSSLRNWFKGYQFRPVQRFRCCEHTTPYHYSWCYAGSQKETGE